MDQFIGAFEDDLDLPPFVEEVQAQNASQKEISQAENQQIILLLNLQDFYYQQISYITAEQNITVDKLKQTIFCKFLKEKENINELIIEFNGIICQGNWMLSEYQIKNNSLLIIKRKTGLITLKILINNSDIKNIFLAIPPFYTFEDIEIRILQYLGLSRDICVCDFYINGIPQYGPFKRTLDELGIKDQEVMQVKVRFIGGCFPNYGPITLGDGSTKLICEINKGDVILSYDCKIKQFRTSKVLEIIISKHLVSLIQIKTEYGSIITTLDHPFYTSEGWKAVQPNGNTTLQKLTLQDKLLNVNNEFVNILEIEDMNQSVQVYTLSTEYPNNFIAFGYVVHNKGPVDLEIGDKVYSIYDIDLSIKIIDIKEAIEEALQIPILQQTLFKEDKIMKDNDTVYGGIRLKLKVERNQFEILQDFSSHQQNINPQQSIMNIIFKESNYYVKVFNNISVESFFNSLKINKFSSTPLVLLDGIEPLQNYFGKKIEDLQNFSFVLIINIDTVKFTQEISSNNIMQLSELKEFISTKVKSINVEQFFENQLKEINTNIEKRILYQQYPLTSLMAIKLWTSNLIYKKINIDFRCYGIKDCLKEWKKYLICLMDGLRFSQLFRDYCYRGIRNYQNTEIYQKGKVIQWNELTSFSKDINVAKGFSNEKGMIFIMETAASKDISNISVYSEEECLLPPFSRYEILDVITQVNNPIEVYLKEIPFPRGLKILLLVDDNPENQFQIVSTIQKEDSQLSFIFATSTEEAIKVINLNKWIIFLKPNNFKIISDMVRVENYIINYTAGVDLLIALQKFGYKGTILFYVKNLEKAKQSLKDEISFLIPNYELTKNIKRVYDFIRFG